MLEIFIWIIGIFPFAIWIKSDGVIRGWGAFWMGVLWPVLVALFILLSPFLLLEWFVKKYL